MKTLTVFIFCIFGFYTAKVLSQNLLVQYKICNNCGAQAVNDNENTNYTYGQTQTFTTNQIASDYGPRRLGADNYDWHGGIDYTSAAGDADRGDLLIAIRGGGVILRVDGNMKSIIVDNGNDDYDFSYRHVFRRTTGFPVISGECALKKMIPNAFGNNGDVTALIVPVFDANGTVTGHRALGDPNLFVQPGQVIWEGDTLNVATNLNAGEPIGPMGDSFGSTSALAVHLHLSCLPVNNHSFADTNTKDPLEFVNHDVPNYDIKILRQNGTQGISLTYPGTTNSAIKVRPKMPNELNGVSVYQNNTMNIDEVKILMKKDFEINSNYALIQGPTYESRISHGARINSARYPANIIEDGTNLPANIGNWTRQGIDPFAYADAASFPWDEYYFADFATRVHKDDPMGNPPHDYAYCPQSARYVDGKYDVSVIITDVQNNTTNLNNNPTEISIDNFKPFIEGLQVFIGAAEVYDMHWDCNDNCEQSGGLHAVGGVTNEPVTDSDIASGMDVTVHTSEPMQSLNLAISVSGSNLPIDNISFISNSPDRQTWVFGANISGFVSPGTATAGTDIQFIFSGTDFPAPGSPPNQLLNLSGSYQPDNLQQNDACVRIPNAKGKICTQRNDLIC